MERHFLVLALETEAALWQETGSNLNFTCYLEELRRGLWASVSEALEQINQSHCYIPAGLFDLQNCKIIRGVALILCVCGGLLKSGRLMHCVFIYKYSS